MVEDLDVTLDNLADLYRNILVNGQIRVLDLSEW